MVDLRSLNSELAYVQGALNYENLLRDVFEAQQKLAAATTSKLGTEIGQVLGGFTTVVQQVEGEISKLTDALPGGIALLTENPPGLEIKKPTPSTSSDLAALTEETIDGGFLNVDVTLGTPKAVAEALTRITDLPATAVKQAIDEVAPQINGVTDKISSVLADVEKSISVVSNLQGSFQQFTSKLQNQIKGSLLNTLQDLPNQLAENIAPLRAPVMEIVGSRPIDPVKQDVTFVSSQVEAQAIFASAQREITEMVVGSTATFKDADVRASDAQGWHFIITRDGELQQVTPIDTVGDYAKDHNTYTVGVAFAGGLQATRGEARNNDRSQYVSSAAISREQWNTFDKLLAQFYAAFPYGQVVGLSDIPGTDTTIPGFDVIAYVKQRFNKVTIVDTSKPAPSLKELQAQMATAAQQLIDPQIEDEPGEG